MDGCRIVSAVRPLGEPDLQSAAAFKAAPEFEITEFRETPCRHFLTKREDFPIQVRKSNNWGEFEDNSLVELVSRLARDGAKKETR
jgi:hypothetical protein